MFLNIKILNIVLNNISNFYNISILWYKNNIGNFLSNNSSLNINSILTWKTSKINKNEVCNSGSGTPLPLHPYHLVDQSPWPLALSGVLLSLTISAVLSFHGYVMGDLLLTCSFILLVWGMSLWFKDVISEASYLGAHTDKVQKGISLGIVLFIISEVFFFLSIFWAYFHSSLAPAIELGGEWPPKGIEPVDASEVPTANTTILLSSGSAVTVSHHSLVNQLIDWANYGSVATIILAILFTGLQVLEYVGVSYTITDSVFGSTFFMATGFHGYMLLLLLILLTISKYHIYYNIIPETFYSSNNISNLGTLRTDCNKKKINSDKVFLEWLVGFTDAEGNFSITIRDYPRFIKNKTEINIMPKYVNLTYQIGMHINHLSTLKYIQKELKCGNISISKNKCNFYISDFNSIINTVIPIFNDFQLNSTKYSKFNIFKNAANIIRSKNHLTYEGLSDLIYLKDIMHKEPYCPDIFNITDNWLIGFMEGDATFSTNKFRPRVRLECQLGEKKLFHKIQDYLGTGKVITSERNRKSKVYKSVILDIHDIYYLKLIFYPKFENLKFYTHKFFDFCSWCKIIDLYYLGYHLLPEGQILINEIKSFMNKGKLFAENYNEYSDHINTKIVYLLIIPSPYIIVENRRRKRKLGKPV
jgi:cytochrome c oxidase subunit 3